MKLAVTMELHAYWNRLRGARSAPERNDVDPSAIRGVLTDQFNITHTTIQFERAGLAGDTALYMPEPVPQRSLQ